MPICTHVQLFQSQQRDYDSERKFIQIRMSSYELIWRAIAY